MGLLPKVLPCWTSCLGIYYQKKKKKKQSLVWFSVDESGYYQKLKTLKDRYLASSIQKNAHSMGIWKFHLMGKIMCILDGIK